jgi:hypothetical protein
MGAQERPTATQDQTLVRCVDRSLYTKHKQAQIDNTTINRPTGLRQPHHQEPHRNTENITAPHGTPCAMRYRLYAGCRGPTAIPRLPDDANRERSVSCIYYVPGYTYSTYGTLRLPDARYRSYRYRIYHTLLANRSVSQTLIHADGYDLRRHRCFLC